MELITFILTLSCLFTSFTDGQTTLTSQVVSTFIFTRYGDRSPYVLPQTPSLTPLGAQQLYQAGSNFRQRYVSPILGTSNGDPTNIRNISPNRLSQDEITILSTDAQYVTASAQAFMQGLYPPLGENSSYTLANGANVAMPLNGIQYPNIETVSSNDLNSIWLAGSSNCPSYATSNADYYKSATFGALQASTRDFYTSLEPQFLNGIFSNASVGYFDAYYIWDYLNYANIHNSTVAQTLLPEDLTKVKILSDDWVFAMNANTSTSSSGNANIATIAGRTLASRILQSFYTTINTQGQSSKMTLLFGSFEPMVAFAALADLVSPQNAAFYNVPDAGSSFVFELFALRQNDTGTYPDTSELFVRFFYQNGTDSNSTLVAYPLFGRSPSEIMMTFSDFIAGIERIMIFNIEDWCTTCNSYSVFCPAFEGTDSSLNPQGKVSTGHRGLSPAIAGVIGAIVTLVVAGLIFAAFMLLGGCRMHRVHNKRKSELGGFKGAEKLASDQDLTLPKGDAGAAFTGAAPVPGRGHERVGSWELSDQAKAEEAQRSVMSAHSAQPKRPSFEDDDLHVNQYTEPVKPRDHV